MTVSTEKITKLLLDNYTEDGLAYLLSQLDSTPPLETMCFWACVYRILDRDSAVVILGYLLDAQESKVQMEKFAQRSLNYHIHMINKKVAKLLPSEFRFYVSQLAMFKFRNVKAEAISAKALLVKNVFDLLFKSSTKLIERSINKYFGISETRKELNYTEEMLKIMSKLEDKALPMRNLIIVITDTDIPRVLEYLLQTNYSEQFFLLLYLTNLALYWNFFETITENKKYFQFIKVLVEIDVDAVIKKIKIDSIDILNYIIESRPVYTERIVDSLISNFPLNRFYLLNVISSNVPVLKLYFTRFELTTEELFTILEVDRSCMDEVYDRLDAHDLQRFVSIIKNESDERLLEFILASGNSPNFHRFLLSLLKTKKLEDDLKTHVLENYLNNKDYFYSLMIYIDKNDLVNYMPVFLTDQESLSYFLNVLDPSDLLIKAHELENLDAGIRITQLCIESSKFTESHFMFVLNYLEKSLPKLYMRTTIIALKKFPALRKFVISLLRSLAKKGIWKYEQLFIGYIKCLEMLDTAGVEIIVYLPRNIIKQVFDINPQLYETCHNYFLKNKVHDRKFRKALEDALRYIPRD